jgi:hypothetical protein
VTHSLDKTKTSSPSFRPGSRLAAQPLPSRWRRFKRWAARHQSDRFDPQQLKLIVAMERLGRV